MRNHVAACCYRKIAHCGKYRGGQFIPAFISLKCFTEARLSSLFYFAFATIKPDPGLAEHDMPLLRSGDSQKDKVHY